jgi:4-amino-4-deoxy-L-arabinose transferase-like glycosyltransferase
MKTRLFWLALGVWSLLLFYHLGSWGLLETSEARYAEMSWEMQQSGDVMHPSFMELQHYHKPPFTYALTALAYEFFGISPWSTRIFLQLALLLQLLLVYQLGRLVFKDQNQARLATLVYASLPILLVASRTLTTDLYLLTFLLLGVWCWLRGEIKGAPTGWTVLAYAAWGLAALTKGAGVVILPAVLIPTYYLLFWPRSWWPVIARHALGSVVFLLVGLSWYAALVVEDGSFLDYFLVEQTIKRYTTDQWTRSQPVWFYLVTVTATALPWFWLVLIVGKGWLKAAQNNRWLFFFLSWMLLPLAFYSFAQSKLILYVLPIYPGIAFLSVYALGLLPEGTLKKWLTASTLGWLTLLVGLLIAPAVTDKVQAGLPYYAFLLLGTAGLVLVYRERQQLSVAVALVLAALVFNTTLLPVGAEFLRSNELLVNSPAPVVDFLRAHQLAGRPVYVLYRRLPAVAFDLQKPVIMLYNQKIARDTTHQNNTNWHSYWLDISKLAVREALREDWQQTPAVVIAYSEPDSLAAQLLEPFQQVETVGRYRIYFDE